MTITREQIADLQPGDVVELAHAAWPEGSTIRGPLYQQKCSDSLYCCGFQATNPDGGLYHPSFWREFTVVSRAPRPLYVNHPRTEPVQRDVVREDGTDRPCIWTYEDPGDDEPWRHIAGQNCQTHGVRWTRVDQMPAHLLLLVDGETGQVVP